MFLVKWIIKVYISVHVWFVSGIWQHWPWNNASKTIWEVWCPGWCAKSDTYLTFLTVYSMFVLKEAFRRGHHFLMVFLEVLLWDHFFSVHTQPHYLIYSTDMKYLIRSMLMMLSSIYLCLQMTQVRLIDVFSKLSTVLEMFLFGWLRTG